MRGRWLGLVGIGLAVGCGGPQQEAQPTGPPPPADGPEVSRPTSAEGTGSGPGCEDGRLAWLAEHSPSGEEPPEGHAASIKEVLNRGTYLNECNIEPSAAVEICAAIAGAEVVGVTVRLDPGSVQQADCVAEKVRVMTYPEHPDLVIARTSFEPSL